jgi:hypothetical protein
VYSWDIIVSITLTGSWSRYQTQLYPPIAQRISPRWMETWIGEGKKISHSLCWLRCSFLSFFFFFFYYSFISSLFFISAIRRVGLIINKKKFQKSKFFFFFLFQMKLRKTTTTKTTCQNIGRQQKTKVLMMRTRSIYTTTPDEFALIRRTIDELLYYACVYRDFHLILAGFSSNDGRSFRRLF